jgi:hypothetical protein
MSSQMRRFQQLCQQEPRLLQLYRRVQAIRDNHSNPSFCANAHWYGRGMGPRAELEDLVGFHAENPELRTSRDYDVAYDALYDALPGCRNCSCMSAWEVIRYRRRLARRRRGPTGSKRNNRKVASGSQT